MSEIFEWNDKANKLKKMHYLLNVRGDVNFHGKGTLRNPRAVMIPQYIQLTEPIFK